MQDSPSFSEFLIRRARLDEYGVVAGAFGAAHGFRPDRATVLGLWLSVVLGRVHVVRPEREDGKDGPLVAAFRVRGVRLQTLRGRVHGLTMDFLWVSPQCGFELSDAGNMPYTPVQLTLALLDRFRDLALSVNTRRVGPPVRVLTAWIPSNLAEEVQSLEYQRRRERERALRVRALRYPDLFWTRTGNGDGHLTEIVKHLTGV